MSLNLILAENLGLLQKLILFCSAIFILIWMFKIWRHATILITLICGAIVTMSAAYHTTTDVGFMFFGWWALPLGYFILYRSYMQLLKIENGLSEKAGLLWITGVLLPIWLIFSILSLIVFTPILIYLLNVLPRLRYSLFLTSGIIGPLIFYYFFYKFIEAKLHTFPKAEAISNRAYYLLIFGAVLSTIVLIFEFYTYTLGVGD